MKATEYLQNPVFLGGFLALFAAIVWSLATMTQGTRAMNIPNECASAGGGPNCYAEEWEAVEVFGIGVNVNDAKRNICAEMGATGQDNPLQGKTFTRSGTAFVGSSSSCQAAAFMGKGGNGASTYQSYVTKWRVTGAIK